MNKKQYFFRNRKEKIETIGANLSHLFEGKVLDVGCDDCYFKKFAKGQYVGIDKYGKPDIRQDISSGLPFEDKSFDAVAAFDILEHIDNIYFVFDELCRVSRKWVVITLPNIFEWRFRLSFLTGKLLSGKYGLQRTAPADRHRWIFSVTEAKNFIETGANKNNFEISQDAVCYYKYNKILPRIITKIGSLLGEKFQNLFTSNYLVVLVRK